MQYLYLIKCQQFVKIGIATDIQNRLSQLSTGNPFELEVVSLFGFDNAEIVERVIHQKYASQRTRGEWFSLDGKQVIEFSAICESLGGTVAIARPTVTDAKLEHAEKELDEFDSAKWRIEVKQNGKYFQWRERRRNGKVRYGGKFSELPIERQEEYFKHLELRKGN